jgi:hypothetical protein
MHAGGRQGDGQADEPHDRNRALFRLSMKIKWIENMAILWFPWLEQSTFFV